MYVCVGVCGAQILCSLCRLIFEQLLLHDCQITLVDFSNGIVVGNSHVVVAVLQYFVNHTSVHFAIPVCLHMRPVFEC